MRIALELARVPDNTEMPVTNDVGEDLLWCHVEHLVHENAARLCPNVDYLVPKAIVFLRTERLARPC